MHSADATNDIEQRADFDFIRYAQCWEDADILLAGLNITAQDDCLSIASAGDNSFSLLCASPSSVTAIDLSQVQLYCVELRAAAYQLLEHEEILVLMGSEKHAQREKIFLHCLKQVSQEAKDFWRSQIQQVNLFGIGGIGKFESYFKIFREKMLPWVHSKKTIRELFEQKSKEERILFFNRRWNSWRWKSMVSLFFSQFVMGRLGRDPAFFKFVEGSVAKHVASRVEHALTELDPCENPYLQWILLGKHQSAWPHALRASSFPIIKKNIERLSWRLSTLDTFASNKQRFDVFNLSNIFEYMSEQAHYQNYRTLLEISNANARYAYWNMMVPRSVPKILQSQVSTRDSRDLYAQDKAFFYTNYLLEQKC